MTVGLPSGSYGPDPVEKGFKRHKKWILFLEKLGPLNLRDGDKPWEHAPIDKI